MCPYRVSFFARVIKTDPCTQKLWDIYEAVHKEGVIQVSKVLHELYTRNTSRESVRFGMANTSHECD